MANNKKAKAIFLTSAKAVEANKALVDQLCTKQNLPAVVVGQLGNRVIAIPTKGLRATIFGVSAKEGYYSLRTCLGSSVIDGQLTEGDLWNLKLDGWAKVYPAGAEAPEGAVVLTIEETKAVESFKKGSKMWMEFNEEFIYVVLALTDEGHYPRDAAGNKIPSGTDAEGNPVYELHYHKEITFPLGVMQSTLKGSGTSAGITKDEMSAAAERAKALMGSSARSL